MTWFDIVVLLLVASVAWLESNRGFGRAIFDVIGAIVVLKIATFAAHPLGLAFPLSRVAGTSDAIWLVTVFVALMVLVVIGSRFLYETTLLSLDVLDPVVGGLLGAISGMIISYVFLRTMLLVYGDSQAANVLLGSFVGQELIKFRTFHTVLTTLQNLGEG